ncbi:MAG: hypothetical protein K0B05_11570 [Bacteroidales bacterium]|nr:hypothetical protein [Bacteroidales bacterium]
MKKITFIFFLSCSVNLSGQHDFDKFFTDKVLRLDFMFAGDFQKTLVYPAGMKEEPFWAGSKTNLIDPFNYGNFKYEVFDPEGETRECRCNKGPLLRGAAHLSRHSLYR